jgi:hypothetical protein
MPGIIETHAHLGYWKDLTPSVEHFTREQPISSKSGRTAGAS